jgi:hypothetical protein
LDHGATAEATAMAMALVQKLLGRRQSTCGPATSFQLGCVGRCLLCRAVDYEANIAPFG